MQTVSASEFKATCLALLDKVAKTGQPIVVTKRGKPIAQLGPAPARKKRVLGSMADRTHILGDIVSPVFDPNDWEDPALRK